MLIVIEREREREREREKDWDRHVNLMINGTIKIVRDKFPTGKRSIVGQIEDGKMVQRHDTEEENCLQQKNEQVLEFI